MEIGVSSNKIGSFDESSKEYRKSNGSVYTPQILANYVSWKVVTYLLRDYSEQQLESLQNKTLKILDPACGDGELLSEIWLQLKVNIGKKFGKEKAEFLKPEEVLCGIDNDNKALLKAKERISKLGNLDNSYVDCANFLATNALFPIQGKTSKFGRNYLLKYFNAEIGFDVVIANPPWGADVSSYKERLSKKEFCLYGGQYDTSDLFLELAFSLVKNGGYIAFIVPDSLFSLERSALRKYLLENSNILFVGRLGEKIFKDVNRACAVIICKKGMSNELNTVDCLRLSQSLRNKIISGELEFKDAESELLHKVPQKRFINNQYYNFDIDISLGEDSVIRRISDCRKTFRDYLKSYRGVELSKTGMVWRCEFCKEWFPQPSMRRNTCPHCGVAYVSDKLKKKSIVSNKRETSNVPFIVGKDVHRYKLDQALSIENNIPGINYKKSSIYKGPKILVRKTGVGISASIDYSDSYTNQVVYIFQIKDEFRNIIPLEVFLAILCSRAIYYYVIKNNGEIEWRSHPYITQNQVLNIPVPDLIEYENKNKGFFRSVSNSVKSILNYSEDVAKLDSNIESDVCGLYGLDVDCYIEIYNCLNSIEDLLPVRKLKTITIEDIF